jgi:hypothetical protein
MEKSSGLIDEVINIEKIGDIRELRKFLQTT